MDNDVFFWSFVFHAQLICIIVVVELHQDLENSVKVLNFTFIL